MLNILFVPYYCW